MYILPERLVKGGGYNGNFRGTKGGTLGYRGRILGNHNFGWGKILGHGENIHPWTEWGAERVQEKGGGGHGGEVEQGGQASQGGVVPL